MPGGGPGHRADQGRTRPGPRLQRGRLADDLAHGAVLDPGAAADGTEHGRAGLHPDPQGPSVDRRHRREGAEGRPGRPLGVVLVRLRRPEHGLEPSPGHRRHRPAQRLHLGDHRGQAAAGHVAELLRVGEARRGHLGGEHADGPELLPRRGLRPGRPGLEGGRGVHLLQPRGQAEPELAEGGPAALVGAYRELPVSLGEVAADQGRGRLLGGGIVLGAGRPGGELGFGPGVACPPGPVPGQGQPRLLAQRLQPLPRAQRPVGVRLVGEQLAVVGQGGREQVIAFLAGAFGQRGAQSLLVFGGVDLDGRVRPDVGQVGLEQGGRVRAERREGRPGHRQRLGDRTGGRARVQIPEELLADEVPADPPARAHQDKLAEPPGARPRPRARGAAPGDDGERPEQPDPYGHIPIVAHCVTRFSRAAEPAGTPREQRLPTVAAEPSERGIRDVHGVHDLPGRAAQVRSRAARDRL